MLLENALTRDSCVSPRVLLICRASADGSFLCLLITEKGSIKLNRPPNGENGGTLKHRGHGFEESRERCTGGKGKGKDGIKILKIFFKKSGTSDPDP